MHETLNLVARLHETPVVRLHTKHSGQVHEKEVCMFSEYILILNNYHPPPLCPSFLPLPLSLPLLYPSSFFPPLSSPTADYPRDSNYLYAVPLKQFYNDAIKVASKTSITPYQVPHSKGVSLFCSSHLSDQFLRLAVAVKNKVYMLAYKHPAAMLYEGSPVTPLSSTDPKDNFIKHRVGSTSLSKW